MVRGGGLGVLWGGYPLVRVGARCCGVWDRGKGGGEVGGGG